MRQGFSAFIFLAAIFAVTASSCRRKPVDIPSNILSREEMASVLTDVHLAEAFAGKNSMRDSVQNYLSSYSAMVLEMHHLSVGKYDSSLEFYSQHPELLQQVYEEVISDLSKKQGEASGKSPYQ